MTNVERVRDCIRANSRYGSDVLLQRLSIENAVTLAAIADALERIAQSGREEQDDNG